MNSLTAGAFGLRSFIFTTNVGMRPAEPCTISVAATHQLLTQILLSIMRLVGAESKRFVLYAMNSCQFCFYQSKGFCKHVDGIELARADSTSRSGDCHRGRIPSRGLLAPGGS